MKRDMDLVRHILMEVEQSDYPIEYSSLTNSKYSSDVVLYHAKIMEQAGLIDCEIDRTYAGDEVTVLGLTWDGQEFLAAIKTNAVWDKVKSTIAKHGGSATFDIMKSLASGYLSAIVLG